MKTDDEKHINKDMNLPNCFHDFQLNDKKDKRVTFHDIIQKNNDYLLNFFEHQSYYRELMPLIQKSNRGYLYYNKIVRKGYKHKSPFFKSILKAIKDINEEKNKNLILNKPKRLNVYMLPQIELLKLKKEKIEQISVKKLKNIEKRNERYNSYKNMIKDYLASSSSINFNSSQNGKKLISPSSTFNLNTTTTNSFNNNSSENFIKKLSFSPLNKDLSTFYMSNTKFKSLSRNKSNSTFMNSPKYNKRNINFIYDKCIEEIEHGNSVAEKVFIFDKKISKSIERKLKKNKIVNKDKNIIEDKSQKKNKYIKLEENNYAEIKRKMNAKISYFYAYNNRKEFHGLLKNNENAHAYLLYLDEINKINERLGRHRKIERKRIDKVETLCEEGFRKKEFLKNKIDIYNKRHRDLEKQINLIPNDDFYISNTSNKGNKIKQTGTLLPKLLSFKEESLKKIPEGNSLNQDII